jgi:hypothetical protein
MALMRVLAVADEVASTLYDARVRELHPDLVVSCGDLPADYLEFIVGVLNVPLLFVPGNHDPMLRQSKPALTSVGFRDAYAEGPGPLGCVNLDGRVDDTVGLRLAGLGGSVRYREGPNQYSQAEMRRRALRLELRLRAGRVRGTGLDIFVSHAPPLHLGDGPDPAHRGFAAFHRLIRRLSPQLMVHGHIHPYGMTQPDRQLGATRIVNVVPYRMLEIET